MSEAKMPKRWSIDYDGYRPDELVGALNDRIHPASGRLLNATPIHAKLKEAKP
jgi:hypothetical protein